MKKYLNIDLPTSTLVAVSIASVLLGVATDFIVSGVFKIVWAWIYVTVYLTLASTYFTYLHQSRWVACAVPAAGVFFFSCLVGHAIFSETHEIRNYLMDLPSGFQPDSKIVLKTSRLSRSLFVTSEAVKRQLSQIDTHSPISVTIEVTKNYGCIDAFKVKDISGVDIMYDKEAYWTWRQEGAPPADTSGFDGKDEENLRRLWCRIRWF